LPVKVILLGSLRSLVSDGRSIEVEGSTVEDALESLRKRSPGLEDGIRDETGRVREFINIFVRGREIRSMQDLSTSLRDGETMYVVPSVAGGYL
jgi:molybdopterin synthase sulfur carrier subunit